MLDQTTENKILHQQIEQLRKEFAVLFEKRNHMLTYEEPILTSFYLNSIGSMQFRVFTLKGDLAILNEKIRMGQVFFNRNELPNWAEIEQQVKQQFVSFQQKVAAEESRLASARDFLKSDFLSDEESKQLKEVYRLLVKRLHPDINPNQPENERDLFYSVQAAYQLLDILTLNQILLALNEPTNSLPEVVIDLKLQIDKLTKMTTDLQEKINSLNDTFPFVYRDLLYDIPWLESQKKISEEQILILEKDIKEKTDYLLLLQSWKPQLLH